MKPKWKPSAKPCNNNQQIRNIESSLSLIGVTVRKSKDSSGFIDWFCNCRTGLWLLTLLTGVCVLFGANGARFCRVLTSAVVADVWEASDSFADSPSVERPACVGKEFPFRERFVSLVGGTRDIVDPVVVTAVLTKGLHRSWSSCGSYPDFSVHLISRDLYLFP